MVTNLTLVTPQNNWRNNQIYKHVNKIIVQITALWLMYKNTLVQVRSVQEEVHVSNVQTIVGRSRKQ